MAGIAGTQSETATSTVNEETQDVRYAQHSFHEHSLFCLSILI